MLVPVKREGAQYARIHTCSCDAVQIQVVSAPLGRIYNIHEPELKGPYE